MSKTCGLCGLPMDGFAGVNGVNVCHGEQRDCYRLATVYAGFSHEQFERVLASYYAWHGPAVGVLQEPHQ